MLRFVDMLLDDVRKFVAEAGTMEFVIVGGDIRGSWKSDQPNVSAVHFWKRYRPKSSGMHALLN